MKTDGRMLEAELFPQLMDEVFFVARHNARWPVDEQSQSPRPSAGLSAVIKFYLSTLLQPRAVRADYFLQRLIDH